MGLHQSVIEMLSQELDGDKIKGRTQSGQTLFYLEGHEAIASANRIFGFDGWDSETLDTEVVVQEPCTLGKGTNYEREGWSVTIRCRVRVYLKRDGEALCFHDGTGYGSGEMGKLGAAHESAGKEAETDAKKRALMNFGNQFGLSLYVKFYGWAASTIAKIAACDTEKAVDGVVSLAGADMAKARKDAPHMVELVTSAANARKHEIEEAHAKKQAEDREQLAVSWSQWLADYKIALDGKTEVEINAMQKTNKADIAKLGAFDAAMLEDLKIAVGAARENAPPQIDPADDGATPEEPVNFIPREDGDALDSKEMPITASQDGPEYGGPTWPESPRRVRQSGAR